jgi:hypothetical protein
MEQDCTFKLMLNELEVLGDFTFIYTPWDLAQGIFMRVSMCPSTKEVFKKVPNYK